MCVYEFDLVSVFLRFRNCFVKLEIFFPVHSLDVNEVGFMV